MTILVKGSAFVCTVTQILVDTYFFHRAFVVIRFTCENNVVSRFVCRNKNTQFRKGDVICMINTTTLSQYFCFPSLSANKILKTVGTLWSSIPSIICVNKYVSLLNASWRNTHSFVKEMQLMYSTCMG